MLVGVDNDELPRVSDVEHHLSGCCVLLERPRPLFLSSRPRSFWKDGSGRLDPRTLDVGSSVGGTTLSHRLQSWTGSRGSYATLLDSQRTGVHDLSIGRSIHSPKMERCRPPSPEWRGRSLRCINVKSSILSPRKAGSHLYNISADPTRYPVTLLAYKFCRLEAFHRHRLQFDGGHPQRWPYREAVTRQHVNRRPRAPTTTKTSDLVGWRVGVNPDVGPAKNMRLRNDKEAISTPHPFPRHPTAMSTQLDIVHKLKEALETGNPEVATPFMADNFTHQALPAQYVLISGFGLERVVESVLMSSGSRPGWELRDVR